MGECGKAAAGMGEGSEVWTRPDWRCPVTHPTNPSAVTGKHTAGQVTVRGHDIIDESGRVIATTSPDWCDCGNAVADVHAAMIAHALNTHPDLLEACKVLLKYAEGTNAGTAWTAPAIAAIRKAEGGGE